MDRILFFQLVEKYYQLKKKETADDKAKFIKLYIEAVKSGYAKKEIKSAFKTVDGLLER